MADQLSNTKAPTITQSIFQGSPHDAVAAVDVYKDKTGDTVNNYRSTTEGYLSRITKGLGSNKKSLLNITKALTSSRFSQADTFGKMDQLLKASGSGLSIKTLSDDAKNTLAQYMGKDGEYINKLQVKIGDTMHDISQRKYTTAAGFMGMLKGIVGDGLIGELTDTESEVTYFSGLLSEASEWGSEEIVDTVINKVKEPKTRRLIYSRYGEHYTSSQSLEGIEALIKANPGDAQTLTQKRPNLPLSILSGYKFKSGTTPTDYPERLRQLLYVLDHLMPNWSYSQRGDKQIPNLAMLVKASDDASLLLSTDERYRAPVLIASNYPSLKTERVIKNFYPMIAL